MSRKGLCCSKASLGPSTSIYDIRKEIFEPGYIEAIDNTLDFNLVNWESACPLGYSREEIVAFLLIHLNQHGTVVMIFGNNEY